MGRIPVKHLLAAAALFLMQIAGARATVTDATLSFSGPLNVPVGSTFSMGVDLQLLPGVLSSGVEYFDATIFYFPQSAPPSFYGHTALVLQSITGPILSLPDYAPANVVPTADPRQGPQASAFLNVDGTPFIPQPTSRILNLGFQVSSDAVVGTTIPVTVAITLFDPNLSPISVTPATTNVTVLSPTASVPEASTAVLIVGGLLLVVFARRKLKLSPH
jgi:hypothetical protein